VPRDDRTGERGLPFLAVRFVEDGNVARFDIKEAYGLVDDTRTCRKSWQTLTKAASCVVSVGTIPSGTHGSGVLRHGPWSAPAHVASAQHYARQREVCRRVLEVVATVPFLDAVRIAIEGGKNDPGRNHGAIFWRVESWGRTSPPLIVPG
jgi:hypothetical protein